MGEGAFINELLAEGRTKELLGDHPDLVLLTNEGFQRLFDEALERFLNRSLVDAVTERELVNEEWRDEIVLIAQTWPALTESRREAVIAHFEDQVRLSELDRKDREREEQS